VLKGTHHFKDRKDERKFATLALNPQEIYRPIEQLRRRHCMSSRYMTRSSAIAEGPRDASCQLKSCQLPRNSAETTYTTSPDQIDGRKLEI